MSISLNFERILTIALQDLVRALNLARYRHISSLSHGHLLTIRCSVASNKYEYQNGPSVADFEFDFDLELDIFDQSEAFCQGIYSALLRV